jgi:hypothetical protein
MSSRDEVLRMASLLEAVFRVAKIPVRDFEHRIGMGSGTLTRIFRGEIDLKFRHVFDVLDGLGVSHEEFFRLAYKDSPTRSELLAQEMMKLLGNQMPVRPSAQLQEGKLAAEPITEEDIDRRIEKALRDHGMLPKKKRTPKKKGEGNPPPS